MTTSTNTAPITITRDEILKHVPCQDGLVDFDRHCPDGVLVLERPEDILTHPLAMHEDWLIDAELLSPIVSVVPAHGTATAGDYGTAAAGDRGTSIAGRHGTAAAGDRGTATAGRHGTATAGHHGTATAGHNGTATSGNEGAATAGCLGTATAGHQGTATAGHNGKATAGFRGTAKAGDNGTATVGDRGIAIAGNKGTVAAGEGGVIMIELLVGRIGEDGLKPRVPYRAVDGQFVDASARYRNFFPVAVDSNHKL